MFLFFFGGYKNHRYVSLPLPRRGFCGVSGAMELLGLLLLPCSAALDQLLEHGFVKFDHVWLMMFGQL